MAGSTQSTGIQMYWQTLLMESNDGPGNRIRRMGVELLVDAVLVAQSTSAETRSRGNLGKVEG